MAKFTLEDLQSHFDEEDKKKIISEIRRKIDDMKPKDNLLVQLRDLAELIDVKLADHKMFSLEKINIFKGEIAEVEEFLRDKNTTSDLVKNVIERLGQLSSSLDEIFLKV